MSLFQFTTTLCLLVLTSSVNAEINCIDNEFSKLLNDESSREIIEQRKSVQMEVESGQIRVTLFTLEGLYGGNNITQKIALYRLSLTNEPSGTRATLIDIATLPTTSDYWVEKIHVDANSLSIKLQYNNSESGADVLVYKIGAHQIHKNMNTEP